MFMWGGGNDWGGCDFFDETSLLKMPGSSKKIAGLITHYFGGNRTPKLENSDFETTIKQGLSESRHFNRDKDPANTMVRRSMTLSHMTEAIRVRSCQKKPFI